MPSRTSKVGSAIFSSLSKSLQDPAFVQRHRTAASAFTRDRKLPFHRLCLILIWNLPSALHLDLKRFFRQAVDIEAPHPTAFSKARAFLKASAFVDLNDDLVATARDQGQMISGLACACWPSTAQPCVFLREHQPLLYTLEGWIAARAPPLQWPA